MALGLPTASGNAGDRTAVLKYDARAGKLLRVDRSDASGRWESEDVEITPVFAAVMDLENIEVGWAYFPSGGAPDIRTVKVGTPLPQKPSELHKNCFRIYMRLSDKCGGDVREMCSNAMASREAMDILHDEYLAGVAEHPGQLPVVKMSGTISIKSTGKNAEGKPVSSTNYKPVWKIDRWVDRPAELNGEHAPQAPAAAPPVQQAPARPPATGSAKVAAPAPVYEDDDEDAFG